MKGFIRQILYQRVFLQQRNRKKRWAALCTTRRRSMNGYWEKWAMRSAEKVKKLYEKCQLFEKRLILKEISMVSLPKMSYLMHGYQKMLHHGIKLNGLISGGTTRTQLANRQFELLASENVLPAGCIGKRTNRACLPKKSLIPKVIWRRIGSTVYPTLWTNLTADLPRLRDVKLILLPGQDACNLSDSSTWWDHECWRLDMNIHGLAVINSQNHDWYTVCESALKSLFVKHSSISICWKYPHGGNSEAKPAVLFPDTFIIDNLRACTAAPQTLFVHKYQRPVTFNIGKKYNLFDGFDFSEYKYQCYAVQLRLCADLLDGNTGSTYLSYWVSSERPLHRYVPLQHCFAWIWVNIANELFFKAWKKYKVWRLQAQRPFWKTFSQSCWHS